MILKMSDIRRCPFLRFDPGHYRDDGSCKCHPPRDKGDTNDVDE